MNHQNTLLAELYVLFDIYLKKVLINISIFFIYIASGAIPFNLCFFMIDKESYQLAACVACGPDNSNSDHFFIILLLKILFRFTILKYSLSILYFFSFFSTFFYNHVVYLYIVYAYYSLFSAYFMFFRV